MNWMPKHWKAAAAAAALVAIGGAPVFAANYANTTKPAFGKKGEVGLKTRNFFLSDAVSGKVIALSDYEQVPLKVLYFASLESPTSNAYWDELKALQAKYKDIGIQVMAIYSEPGVTAEKVAAVAKKNSIEFPMLVDDTQRAAMNFGVKKTPEAFVIDEHRAVQYRGRIDNQFAQGEDATNDIAFVDRAMTEISSRVPVTKTSAEPTGTMDLAPRVIQTAEPVTFTKQVSRILQDNCEVCHREQGIGPMTFGEYKTAKMWGPMMKEALIEQRMPPWHADPRLDLHYSNDRSISSAEIDTIVAWVDGGMPEGDAAQMPAKKVWEGGEWQTPYGKPDYVFTMSEEYTIPAAGSIPYQSFRLPTNFEKDVWVRAVEVKAGNPKVVHHIIASVSGGGGGGSLASIAPGEDPIILKDGIARKIPAGASIGFQVHYTAIGKVEKDRSYIGLWVAPYEVTHESRTASAGGRNLILPPGQDNVEVGGDYTFAEDSYIHSFHPHMHVRGKSMKYTLTKPGEQPKVVFNVPAFDFNWQSDYHLSEPLFIPAGSTLNATSFYDNSVYNYANPDPTEEVRYGSQTWEEMHIGYFTYTTVRSIAERAAARPDQVNNDEQSVESDTNNAAAAAATGVVRAPLN